MVGQPSRILRCGLVDYELLTSFEIRSEPRFNIRTSGRIIKVRRNRAMWEEDPSYQNSNFRFLVGTVLCALLAGPIVALWTGDWGFYQGFLGALAAGVTVWPGA